LPFLLLAFLVIDVVPLFAMEWRGLGSQLALSGWLAIAVSLWLRRFFPLVTLGLFLSSLFLLKRGRYRSFLVALRSIEVVSTLLCLAIVWGLLRA